jgi:hypothetical protein
MQHGTDDNAYRGELSVPRRVILKWISWTTGLKRMRWDGHVAQMGGNAYKIYSENLNFGLRIIDGMLII